MCEKLPVRDFKWSNKLDKFTDEFIENYDKNSDEGYILELVQIHTNYCEFKNRVNKQLIKHFKKLHDTKKSKYLDDDDAEIAENDYYKPILVKSFHNDGYKEYESRGDKIIPYLKELIDIHKAIENNSKKWKVQLNAKIKKCFFR